MKEYLNSILGVRINKNYFSLILFGASFGIVSTLALINFPFKIPFVNQENMQWYILSDSLIFFLLALYLINKKFLFKLTKWN